MSLISLFDGAVPSGPRQVAPARVKRSAAVYDAAGSGRRFRGWQATPASADASIFTDGEVLRRRARDIVRQNAWASRALDVMVDKTVGAGITPRSKHPRKATRQLLTDLWADWCTEADADGNLDFYGQQQLALRSVIESGECLVRKRFRRASDGLRIPFQLQLLESEHLPIYHGIKPNSTTNRVLMGIEFDSIGRRVAYHLYRDHPDSVPFMGTDMSLSSVPADQVMHLFRPLRPGQQRGTTWFTQALIKLRDLHGYDDAELVRKNMASRLNWFITETDAADPVLPSTEDDTDDEAMYEMEAGTAIRLKPGESIQLAQASDVGQMYEQFMRVQLRAVAMAVGVSYESLTGDLTGVNFSSIRHGELDARRRAESIQWHMLTFQFCRKVWNEFVRQAALAGFVDPTDYNQNRSLYEKVEWAMPKQAWVDPLEEVEAEVAEIRGGLKSRQQSVSARGYDVEEIDRQQAEDKRRATSLGLVYDSDAQTTAKPASGSAAAAGNTSDAARQEMVQ